MVDHKPPRRSQPKPPKVLEDAISFDPQPQPDVKLPPKPEKEMRVLFGCIVKEN